MSFDHSIGVGDNSEILSINIEYDDLISSDHPFPKSFSIEITSSKTGKTNTYEFVKTQDQLRDQPIDIWINDDQAEGQFSLHQDSDWDKVETNSLVDGIFG